MREIVLPTIIHSCSAVMSEIRSRSSMDDNGEHDVDEDAVNIRGGLDFEFSPAPDRKFVCPICWLVLSDPMQTKCGHRFCKSCLVHWLRESPLSQCPSCKTSTSRKEMFPDNYAKREIGGFFIVCPNKRNGCDARMELRDVQTHLSDICPFAYCSCPNGCSELLLRKHLNSHLEDICPAVNQKLVVCGLCASSIAPAERQISQAPSKESTSVQCLLRPFGCLEQCQTQQMKSHMIRNMSSHIEMLAQYVVKLDRNDHDLETKLTSALKKLISGSEELNADVVERSKIGHLPPSRVKHREKRLSILDPDDVTIDQDKDKDQRAKNVSLAAVDAKSHRVGLREDLETSTIVEFLQKTVKEQAKQLVDCCEYIKRLEHTVYDLGARNSHGMYIWNIANFKKRFQEARSNRNSILHSPGFYSGYYGHKACLRVHLNGTGVAWGNHLSLFVHFMQGDYDGILSWPFHGRITLAVLDQNDDYRTRVDVSESMEPNPELEAFERPREKRNHKGFGYMEFIPLATLLNSNYVRNDTLYVKVTVDPV